jgi:hypothetical protein
VIIGPSERTTLEQWARRRTTAQRLAQRARIILECAAGHSTVTIAHELRITRQTVGRWRQRFVQKRQRSPRTVAHELDLSHATLGQICAFGLQHRSETFKLSRDPLFVEKVRDIVGLYLAPRTEFWCSASMRRVRFKR